MWTTPTTPAACGWPFARWSEHPSEWTDKPLTWPHQGETPLTEQHDLAKRVTDLEHHMTEIRRDSADALILAKAADRDLSSFRAEFRAHRQALNALRETQIEHGRQLRGVRTETRDLRTEMRQGFARVDGELSTVRTDITTMKADLSAINGELNTVKTDITSMKAGLSAMNGELTAINGELSRMNADMTAMNADITTINSELGAMNGEIIRLRDGIGDVAVGQAHLTVLLTEALNRPDLNPNAGEQED